MFLEVRFIICAARIAEFKLSKQVRKYHVLRMLKQADGTKNTSHPWRTTKYIVQNEQLEYLASKNIFIYMFIHVNNFKKAMGNCAHCTKSLPKFLIDCLYRERLGVLYTITGKKKSHKYIDADAPMHRPAMRNRFRRIAFHHIQAWRHDASMVHFLLKGSIA